MFKKKTDEKSSTARVANTTTINVSPSPVIYYAGDDKYTDHHIKDKIETVDPAAAAAAKVCHIVVRYFNNLSLSLLLKPV